MTPNGIQTQLEHRLSWARTPLIRMRTIDNAQHGVSTLSEEGEALTEKSVTEHHQAYVAAYMTHRAARAESKEETDTTSLDVGVDVELNDRD